MVPDEKTTADSDFDKDVVKEERALEFEQDKRIQESRPSGEAKTAETTAPKKTNQDG